MFVHVYTNVASWVTSFVDLADVCFYKCGISWITSFIILADVCFYKDDIFWVTSFILSADVCFYKYDISWVVSFILSADMCFYKYGISWITCPFSIAITSLAEERANLSAFRTFIRFALVWFCLFSLPPGVWEVWLWHSLDFSLTRFFFLFILLTDVCFYKFGISSVTSFIILTDMGFSNVGFLGNLIYHYCWRGFSPRKHTCIILTPLNPTFI